MYMDLHEQRTVITLTDKELCQYRKLVQEAADLQNRIDKLYDKDIDVMPSKVIGTSKHFPYLEFRMGVYAYDPKQKAERDKMIAMYQDKLEKARKEALRIEQFINSIPDSELRQIFRYRYIDGMKLREIAELMNMDRSSVGKKIRGYLNFPPIPQNV